MLSSLANLARSGMNMLKAGVPLGLKTLKYFIDSTFRDQVTPEPGSVLYCDLWVAVEHSTAAKLAKNHTPHNLPLR